MVNQYFVYIISLVIDNCLSWISRWWRMTIEMISWSLSMKVMAELGFELMTTGSAVRWTMEPSKLELKGKLNFPVQKLIRTWNTPHAICTRNFLLLFIGLYHVWPLQTYSGRGSGPVAQLVIRRLRVWSPLCPATFFRGDWSWHIFYGHSLPSTERMNVHKHCLED